MEPSSGTALVFGEQEGQLSGLCWVTSDEVLTLSSAGIVNWSIPSGKPCQEWNLRSSPIL